MRAGLRNPVRIKVKVENTESRELQSVPEKLQSFYAPVPLENKLEALIWFLQEHRNHKVIVYFLTCATVDYMYSLMNGLDELKGTSLFSLHGKVPSKKRQRILNGFSSPSLKSGVLLVTDVAARGIDFPDVDWVVQFDAPQDPSSYTHRVGRTARNNRDGSCLLLLTPEEDGYVEFLSVKGTPVEEMVLPGAKFPSLFERVRERAVQERELYEKSQLAYVSYVRGYRGHICSYIFRLANLDLGHLATCFCLARLPFMPELKGKKRPSNFQPCNVKHNQIPFKDPVKEKQRLEKLQREREEQQKQETKKKKEPKHKLRRGKVVARVANVHEFNQRELDELTLESRILKKEKRGKLSAKQVENKMKRELEQLEEQDKEEALRLEKKRKKKKQKQKKREENGIN